MAITDPYAVQFSDRRIRVSADQLARSYYRSVSLISRWNALGGGQPAINVMGTDMRAAADCLVSLYELCFRVEKVWFLGLNTTYISNDTTAVFDNGNFTAQDPNRPLNTTAKVNGVMNRVVQFQNWLFSATFSFTDSLRNNASAYNTVLTGSNEGPVVLTVANAGNLITRFTEYKTNYEASTNVNLNSVLALAVNPNPPQAG